MAGKSGGFRPDSGGNYSLIADEKVKPKRLRLFHS
jgi:hypothetical protein